MIGHLSRVSHRVHHGSRALFRDFAQTSRTHDCRGVYRYGANRIGRRSPVYLVLVDGASVYSDMISGMDFVSPLTKFADPAAEAEARARAAIANLGLAFQRIRLARDYTPHRVAAKMHSNQSRICAVEEGRREIVLRYGWQLSLALNTRFSAVVGMNLERFDAPLWMERDHIPYISVEVLMKATGRVFGGVREERGLSQQYVRQLVGATHNDLSHVEQATRGKPLLFYAKLAAAYDISFPDLLWMVENAVVP